MELDARSHQLKILKLENRALKPLAETVLGTSSRKAKIAAVSAAAAVLLTLQSAPEEFYHSIGVANGQSIELVTSGVYGDAVEKLNKIQTLVEQGVGRDVMYDTIRELFVVVDHAHATFEASAKEKSAKLIDVLAGGGFPKEDPLVSWLAKRF